MSTAFDVTQTILLTGGAGFINFAVARDGRPGETYNIGIRSEFTNLEVVRTICGVLDELKPADYAHQELIEFVSDRPGHDHRYSIDPLKIENEIGWKARQEFLPGIRTTIQWYMDHPEWTRNIKDARVRRGLHTQEREAS